MSMGSSPHTRNRYFIQSINSLNNSLINSINNFIFFIHSINSLINNLINNLIRQIFRVWGELPMLEV